MADMVFGSVAEAVIWAEDQLLRDGTKSQLGKLTPRRGDSKDSAVRHTAEDIRSLAHTISCKVARVEPAVAGMMYRFACGGSDRKFAESVAAELAIHVSRSINAPQTPMHRINALAQSVMLAERRRIQRGERTSIAKLADSVGITRQAMGAAPWSEAIIASREIMERWVSGAERQIGEMLESAGVM